MNRSRNFVLMSMVAVLASLLVPHASAQMITDGPRATLSLNGEWQTAPHESLTFQYPPPAQGWQAEQVPHERASLIDTVGGPYTPQLRNHFTDDWSALKPNPKMAAWFKRDFALPKMDMTGKRAILRFQGLAMKSDTWFNGKKAGTSVLGGVPIEYDVTSFVKAGASNQIVIGLTGREGLIDVANRTYIAPSSGVQAGIWGDVELRIVPDVRTDDVFIKTSVEDKVIEMDVSLVNESTTPRTLQPEVYVRDDKGRGQLTITGSPVTLAPGARKTVIVSKPWANPELWTVVKPALYFAEVSLKENNNVVDRTTERFGFREFGVRGTDFYLNGTRVTQLRNSFLTHSAARKELGAMLVRENIEKPYNTVRLHLGFVAESVLDAADEVGLMIVPESSWHNMSGKFELAKRNIWLPNVVDYTRRLILAHRNRPSVVMWSLTNESIWGGTADAQMEVASALVGAARDLDPTRPLQGDAEVSWGGRLDVINLHYPETTVGELRKNFPNASIVVPNDMYWLKKGAEHTSWRAQFKWDRPLVMGEYWWVTDNLDERSSFMGESGYDWEKWYSQSFGNEEGLPGNEYNEAVKKQTDIYRMQGVAGLNPWSGDRKQVMPTIAVRPVDFHPNFFAGTTTARKVVVFNDTGRNYEQMNLQSRLTVDGVTVWENSLPISVPSGSFQTFELPIEAPALTSQKKGELTVRLRWFRGELSRHVENIYLMPRARWTGDTQGLVLFDPSGQTAKALTEIGLTLPAKTTLTAADLQNARTLIVGQDSNVVPMRGVIEAFVNRGGRVLVLRQNDPNPLFTSLPDIDDKHLSTRAWTRAYAHPVTAGFEDAQFSYWRPDNLVSVKTLNKPSTGSYKVLLDSGGLYGMRWAGLVESSYGSGSVTQSQLKLVENVGQEPMAGHLLAKLIQYNQTAVPQTAAPLRLLSGDNAPLNQVLTAASIVTEKSMQGTGPVLLDASYSPSAAELSSLQRYVQGGGKLWLHGFDPQTAGKIASVLPFKPEFTTFDSKKIQGAARRSDDPLMSNLSSYDFHWTRIDIGSRNGYFGAGQPTAKLGEYVLQLSNLQAGEKLVEPGLLVKIPSGKGTILFDTLAWEGALGGEADRVVRIVSSLATNMGAAVQLTNEKSYSYFQVDLKPHVNRSYVDEVANDGKGGWTDQGTNDLRYFLVNHTGLAQGMDVGVGEFPASVVFASRPFSPVDPTKNNGRAALVLRGKEHDPNAPAQVTGMAVNKKADKLWFLQASSWSGNIVGQEIGRYLIRYTDGTESVFPIRNKFEIGDVWNPAPLPGAKVGWVGKNEMHSPIGLYVTDWTNPHPDKTIASIDAVGNLAPGQLVLLAITGGVESADAAAGRVVSEWDLGKPQGTTIANNTAGAGTLNMGNNAPVPAEVAGLKGLRFKGGQSLNGDLKQVPGLDVSKPWGVEVTFTPEAKPDGYLGGLFQAMNYGKSGMRFLMTPQMRINVETWAAEGQAKGTKGKSELIAGRVYQALVKFDGSRAYLYLNGKLDSSFDAPLPAPYSGAFQIGTATGPNYNFNGVIHSVKLLAYE